MVRHIVALLCRAHDRSDGAEPVRRCWTQLRAQFHSRRTRQQVTLPVQSNHASSDILVAAKTQTKLYIFSQGLALTWVTLAFVLSDMSPSRAYQHDVYTVGSAEGPLSSCASYDHPCSSLINARKGSAGQIVKEWWKRQQKHSCNVTRVAIPSG